MNDSPNLPDLGDKQFELPIKFAVKQKGATCIVLASLHRLHNPIGAVQSLSKVQSEARMGTGERCPFTPPSWGEVLPMAQFDLSQWKHLRCKPATQGGLQPDPRSLRLTPVYTSTQASSLRSTFKHH